MKRNKLKKNYRKSKKNLKKLLWSYIFFFLDNFLYNSKNQSKNVIKKYKVKLNYNTILIKFSIFYNFLIFILKIIIVLLKNEINIKIK